MPSTRAEQECATVENSAGSMRSKLQTKCNRGKKARSRIPVPKATRTHSPCTSLLKPRTNTVTMETKQPVKISTLSSAVSSTSTTSVSAKNSQVKKVPDFSKLHRQWANKLEKKKQVGRTHIQCSATTKQSRREEFKNPVITTNIGKENREPLTHTSSRDHCAKVKPPEAKINVDAQFDENFEVVPQSLDDILNDRPLRMEGGVSQRFTLAVSNIKKPREIPGEFKIPPSMSRMSFYSHRPRHCKHSSRDESCNDTTANLFNRLVQSTVNSTRTVAKVKRDEDHSSFRNVKLNLEDQLSQVADTNDRPLQVESRHFSSNVGSDYLFNRLVQTTVKSTRTVAKVNSRDLASFRKVKLNLEDELSQAESVNNPSLQVEEFNDDLTLCEVNETDIHSSTFTLDDGDLTDTPTNQPVCGIYVLPRSQFYEVERELCAVFDHPKRVVQCIGGREECFNPLATALDKYYIVPAELGNNEQKCNSYAGPIIFHT